MSTGPASRHDLKRALFMLLRRGRDSHLKRPGEFWAGRGYGSGMDGGTSGAQALGLRQRERWLSGTGGAGHRGPAPLLTRA